LRTAFYFTEDAFYRVPISMFSDPKSEIVIATGIMKRWITVNEKHAFVDIIFLD